MAAKKYYAVKKGKKTGIFRTWEECRASVEGCPGAEYKGFAELAEAESYLGTASSSCTRPESAVSEREFPGTGGDAALEGEFPGTEEDAALGGESRRTGESAASAGESQRTEEDTVSGGKSQGKREDAVSRGWFQRGEGMGDAPREVPEAGTLRAYVDGSYDDSMKKYAFGCVFILPDGRIYTEYGNGDNEQSLRHRNVTGEMLGAMYAVKTAMLSGFSKIEIHYDYEGIEKWVTGAWNSKTELTRKYAMSMREWGKSIKISFTKVVAHTNVYFNELADKMAKTGLREGKGIPKLHSLTEEGHERDL